MRATRTPRSVLLVALAALLLLGTAGCSDDDGDGETSAGDTMTTEAPTDTAEDSETTLADPYGQSTEPEAGTAEATTPPASGDAVVMEDIAFSPATLTVAAGTEVTWTNEDGTTHTTTSEDDVWDSGDLDEGGTFSHTFDEAGTFAYICQIHSGMSGEIVVE